MLGIQLLRDRALSKKVILADFHAFLMTYKNSCPICDITDHSVIIAASKYCPLNYSAALCDAVVWRTFVMQ